PMISRGSSYPEENDRDIRGAIHGDRTAKPEPTPIIHGDLMAFPEPDSHPGSDQAKSSIYAFH
ncbi:hypothetical protein, partial [Pantoea dispersa]